MLTEALKLDLIFADIQLADGLCFEIFSKIKVRCPIIFTTAYNQYALEAFNTNGIDYLLKPIEEKRMKQALEKINELKSQPNMEKILQLLNEKVNVKNTHKDRFMIKIGEQIKSISSENIKAFYSFDSTTYMLTSENNNYIVDYTLDQLEEILDPGLFFRVNRKHLLALTSCKKIFSWSNSRLMIKVDGLSEKVIVARERAGKFKVWLGQ